MRERREMDKPRNVNRGLMGTDNVRGTDRGNGGVTTQGRAMGKKGDNCN